MQLKSLYKSGEVLLWIDRWLFTDDYLILLKMKFPIPKSSGKLIKGVKIFGAYKTKAPDAAGNQRKDTSKTLSNVSSVRTPAFGILTKKFTENWDLTQVVLDQQQKEIEDKKGI